jgi:hypothetical protein
MTAKLTKLLVEGAAAPAFTEPGPRTRVEIGAQAIGGDATAAQPIGRSSERRGERGSAAAIASNTRQRAAATSRRAPLRSPSVTSTIKRANASQAATRRPTAAEKMPSGDDQHPGNCSSAASHSSARINGKF